jgi:hypothetical protein
MSIAWVNVTNISQILALPNQAASGYFWVGILVLIEFVLLLSLLNFGFEMALITSAFITFILSIMLFMMGGLVSSWFVLVFLGVTLFSILYIYVSSTRENV